MRREALAFAMLPDDGGRPVNLAWFSSILEAAASFLSIEAGDGELGPWNADLYFLRDLSRCDLREIVEEIGEMVPVVTRVGAGHFEVCTAFETLH